MRNFLSDLRADFPASVVVFFVALPLCLGIALASGAPIFSGIISGIVGGVVVGLASGSRFGVSGPTAALVVLVLSYIKELGSFEALLLAVIFAGLIQVVMGFMRLGTIAYYFPASVLRGIIAGIGIVIVIRQIPHVLGYDPEIIGDFGEFALVGGMTNLENALIFMTPDVLLISAISLLTIILWDGFLSSKHRFFSIVRAPLVAVIIGVILNNNFDLEAHHIVEVPVTENFAQFFSHIILPDFAQFTNVEIYKIGLVIAIIASIETLLSVEVIDKMDPAKNITDPNRELKAQGLGNIVSGFLGGLPLSQIIVRSSANITSGAKTKKSAVLHGILLLIAVLAIPEFLNMIPIASLACILLVIGYKLARPSSFKKIYLEGWHEFAPFIATALGIVVFDVLKGVLIGFVVALICRIRKTNEVVLTKEKRSNITPEMAVDILKEGNLRFVKNLKTDRNLLKQVNENSGSQNPFAFVLSCIDSRTSAELIFDQGLGDIFSCRIAGNVINDDIIGSMEFACKVAGVKLIMVLGHSGCGAIKGACGDMAMGKLTNLLNKIKPSVEVARNQSNLVGSEFVEKVAELNVELATKQITEQSEIIRELFEQRKIAIISGMYDVSTGVVKFG